MLLLLFLILQQLSKKQKCFITISKTSLVLIAKCLSAGVDRRAHCATSFLYFE